MAFDFVGGDDGWEAYDPNECPYFDGLVEAIDNTFFNQSITRDERAFRIAQAARVYNFEVFGDVNADTQYLVVDAVLRAAQEYELREGSVERLIAHDIPRAMHMLSDELECASGFDVLPGLSPDSF